MKFWKNQERHLNLDAGITVSFDRLTVSVGAGVDFAAACPPDVVADAVQVKAKKIEMISVASIVFFMLENLLFTNRHSNGGCVRCFFERKNPSFVKKSVHYGNRVYSTLQTYPMI